MTGCDYFSLWDADSESLTDWGRQLFQYRDDAGIGVEWGRKTEADQPFEREGITDPDALDNATWRKLVRAEEARKEANLPTECPHEPVDDHRYCLFHLSPDACDSAGISETEVCSRFREKITEEATETDAEHTKCFAGGQFRSLSLPYRTLTSDSNRPVQLQFAEIEQLNLAEAVIDERLQLDGSTIRSITSENARFRREVSLDQARLDCRTISFDDSIFEERASFCDAELSATELTFEDCTFRGECDFSDVTVEVNAGDAERRNPVRFHDSTFQGTVDWSDAAVLLTGDIGTEIEFNVEFLGCRFGNGALFTDVTFCQKASLDTGGWTTDDQYSEWNRDDTDEDSSDVSLNVYFEDAAFHGGLRFDDARVDGKVEMENAEVSMGAVDFTNTQVYQLNGEETSFGRGDVTFEDVTIQGDARFGQASFDRGKLVFDDAEIDGDADFQQVSFAGKRATFDGLRTRGSLEMAGALFDVSGGKIRFPDVTIGGVATFQQATFVANRITFERAAVGEQISRTDDPDTVVNFEGTSWEGGTIDFSSSHMWCGVTFDLASFTGNEANFSRMIAGGDTTFRHTEFETTETSFSDLDVRDADTFDLSHAQFKSNSVSFEGIEIACTDTVTFTEAIFEAETYFTGGEVTDADTFDMSHTQFKSNNAAFEGLTIACGGLVTFEKAVFECDTDFAAVEVSDADTVDMSHTQFKSNSTSFEGMEIACETIVDFTEATFGSDVDCSELVIDCGKTVTFTEATFESDVDFSDSEVTAEEAFHVSQTRFKGVLRFDDAEIRSDTIDFSRMSAGSAMLQFRRVQSGGVEINFSNATISDGVFEIGPYDTVYNFEGATVGDIDIGGKDDGRLFEYFVFKNTTFDGFDFSAKKVKEALKQSDWKIHTSYANRRRDGNRGFLASRLDFLGRYYRLVRHGPDDGPIDPHQLETTYMKAKIGADQQGDPDTVSEFFQKELHFRRHTYGHQLWDRSATASDEEASGGPVEEAYRNLKRQTQLVWDWITNATLAVTVGYGEQPSNVVLTSVAIVLGFMFVYNGLDALGPETGWLDYLTYSFQGFIQLVVGIKPTGGVLVSFFTAVEGFIGAFVIALFVITLTRSIDR